MHYTATAYIIHSSVYCMIINYGAYCHHNKHTRTQVYNKYRAGLRLSQERGRSIHAGFTRISTRAAELLLAKAAAPGN